MLRTLVASAAQLAGIVLIVVAAWRLSVTFGVFVAGSWALFVGIFLDPSISFRRAKA